MPNLLKPADRGFEDGTIGNWTADDDPRVALSNSTLAAAEGTHSLRVDFTGVAPSDFVFIHNSFDITVDPITVVSGRTYDISGSAYTPVTSNLGVIALYAVFLDGAGNTSGDSIIFIGNYSEVSDSWVTLSGPAVPPVGFYYGGLAWVMYWSTTGIDGDYRLFDEHALSGTAPIDYNRPLRQRQHDYDHRYRQRAVTGTKPLAWGVPSALRQRQNPYPYHQPAIG